MDMVLSFQKIKKLYEGQYLNNNKHGLGKLYNENEVLIYLRNLKIIKKMVKV